nr:ferrous iron transporter B [Thermoclostridium sp.]
MGLSVQSVGMKLNAPVNLKLQPREGFVVTLAGNPNVGKSTVFNCLTGLNQHTGNWPGKTVTNAMGKTVFHDNTFTLVDVPGTYSILSNSFEEQVARNFICFGHPDVTIVVTDATCLERNLNLVMQIIEITGFVVVCVNLMDEAEKKKIKVDLKGLEQSLGVPVVGTSARSHQGLDLLMDKVWEVGSGQIKTNPVAVSYPKAIEKAVESLDVIVQKALGKAFQSKWVCLRLLEGDDLIIRDICEHTGVNLLHNDELMPVLERVKHELRLQGIDSDTFRDMIVSSIMAKAEETAHRSVSYENRNYNITDRKIDKIVTSRLYGIPIMLALLGLIFWLTVTGANYPSALLASGFSWVEGKLSALLTLVKAPLWLHDMLVLGMYRTLAWVVSVMLPPMAIFFPLFTPLEDLGYLPRVAFNLDNFFQKACAHGKQALT